MNPNPLLQFRNIALLPLALASMAIAGPDAKQPAAAIPPTVDPWEVTASLPLWVSGVDGTAGVLGYTTQTSADFIDIINNLDMIFAATLEARKGRWGGWVDGIYLKASAGADTPGPILNSISIGIEQVTIEAAVFYRAWQSERGYLDIYAGARYWSLGGDLHFDVSDSGVAQVSEQLSEQVVNTVVDEVRRRTDAALATARSQIATQVATTVRSNIASTVSEKVTQVRTALENIQQIAAAHPRLTEVIRNSSRLKSAIRTVAEARIDEKLAETQATLANAQAAGSAVRAAAQAAADAARSAARKAVARAERRLADEIEDALQDAIPSEVSDTASWVDPFIGLRACYRFTDRFYAIAKADIGGFGVSSDLTWSAYGALGCHLTKSGKTTVELGYKHLAIDYTRGGFTYDMATSGPMINMSLKF